MKFETHEDIEAPIDYVFAQVSDFGALERLLRRRGADVQRIVDRSPPAPGMTWDTSFDMRGKQRQMRLELIACEPPAGMRFAATSKSINADLDVALLALSRGRTRLALVAELKPLTLSARLTLQSLKLAKGNIAQRFEMRIASYANDLEDRYLRRA